tara:strand:- start:628 stop:912 length:285 start_codon:yes stop_codon:yes gene_type:complete
MKLSEDFHLEFDDNNVVLVFSEERVRVKKKTGVKENYTYTDKYYYPNVKSALKAYIKKDIDSASESLENAKALYKYISFLEKKMDKLLTIPLIG